MEVKFIDFEQLIHEINIDNIYNGNYKYLGCYNDNKLCGYLIYLELDVIEIMYIYTDKNMRRQGIASKLLSYLYTLNKVIFLEVSNSNIPAINLYYKHDFVVNRIRKNYYGQNVDGIEMKR